MQSDRNEAQDLSILYKHSGVIHVSAALTALERRIYNVLLRHAQPRLKTEDRHSINLKSLAQRLEYRSRNRSHLVKSIESLHSKPVRFNILGKDRAHRDQWVAMQGYLLAEIGFGRDDPDVCYYSFGPAMAKLLAEPSIYTRLSLDSQNRLRQKHAIALHEFYLDALPAHLRQIRLEVAIDTYRELLCLTDRYSEYKHLRSGVLKPAHQDICENGDIDVAQVDQTLRHNRVVSITIQIARKGRSRLPLGSVEEGALALDAPDDDLVEAMIERGIHEPVARSLMEEFPRKQVVGNLRYVDDQSARGQEPGAGYYVAAIRADYAKTQTGAAPRVVTQHSDPAGEGVDITRAYAERYLNSLPLDQQQQLLDDFRKTPQGARVLSAEAGSDVFDVNSEFIRNMLLLHLEHEQPWRNR
ncbi:replication initiation protein [Thioalkalivibrio sp. ALE16]|uniref:replication initiation protein n=1 Tax=Thioalkalivibrio sp. ALE16 TaxID=1158172 RepID=UPI0004767F1E|nr:replication initiation protein [Thioalkalivibrio sp. ALE16]